MTGDPDFLPAERSSSRAYQIMGRVPDGCRLFLADDNMNWPHLCAGEWAVIDENDTEIIEGELFLIKMGTERIREIVFQVLRRPEGIFCHPFNRPRSAAQCDQWLRERRPMWLGDGPYREEYLAEKMVGRMVGVFMAGFNE